jgi:tRNA (cmo5U34)-methyltransferase
MSRDNIYSLPRDRVGQFQFDDEVADVFPDMISRSVPGYASILSVIEQLAGRFVQPGTNVYDLGCSLGAATLAMRQGVAEPDCRIIGLDNSPAMIERCRQVIAEDDARSASTVEVQLKLADIRGEPVSNASMVVLNYTLQFLPLADRASLMQRLYDGMNPGGLLLLSEKVVDEDPHMEELLIDLYHEHKRRNDYSAMEIARKRAALENVLVPETVAAHRERLQKAGFRHSAVWLRYFNFVSIVAIR